MPIHSFHSYNQTWNICCGFSKWYNFIYSSVENSVLFFFVLHLSPFIQLLIHFSCSCLHENMPSYNILGDAFLHHHIGYMRERILSNPKGHCMCTLISKNHGQIDSDTEFEEYMQGHDWSRKTDLAPLNLKSKSCLKFQYLLPSQDFSDLVPSSLF